MIETAARDLSAPELSVVRREGRGNGREALRMAVVELVERGVLRRESDGGRVSVQLTEVPGALRWLGPKLVLTAAGREAAARAPQSAWQGRARCSEPAMRLPEGSAAGRWAAAASATATARAAARVAAAGMVVAVAAADELSMGLSGPSRRIVVEPLRSVPPPQREQPPPRRAPQRTPQPEKQKVRS